MATRQGEFPSTQVAVSSGGAEGAAKSVEARLLLIQLAEELGNVSLACRTLRYSRDSYYRLRRLWETGGAGALQKASRRDRPILKNRVAQEVEEAVVALTLAHPRWSRTRVAEQVSRSVGCISATGVRCVWKRHGLETLGKRLAGAGFGSSLR